MKKDTVLIKIGGRAAAAESSLADLVREMADLKNRYDFILVHGGGAEVSRITKIFGLEPVFRDGVRMTSGPEMEIVDMVLAGKVNKSLVRMFSARGMKAVGISGSDGGLFTGASIDPAGGSRTGRVERVNPEAALLLLRSGYLPVVASTSMDAEGGALNINADEAALEIAKGVREDAPRLAEAAPGGQGGRRRGPAHLDAPLPGFLVQWPHGPVGSPAGRSRRRIPPVYYRRPRITSSLPAAWRRHVGSSRRGASEGCGGVWPGRTSCLGPSPPSGRA